jgi:hypothetical protein
MSESQIPFIENTFVFSLVWSLGATSDGAGRTAFNAFLREKTVAAAEGQRALKTPFPVCSGAALAPPPDSSRLCV